MPDAVLFVINDTLEAREKGADGIWNTPGQLHRIVMQTLRPREKKDNHAVGGSTLP